MTDNRMTIADTPSFDAGYDAGWRGALRSLLQPDPDQHTAMLLAASKIPLERENGGIEVAPFKILGAMVRAFAQTTETKL